MNVRFIISALVTGLLVGCGVSRPLVLTPSERSYNGHTTAGLNCAPLKNGGCFYTGTMGGGSGGATATLNADGRVMHPSLAEPELTRWTGLYNLYCAPTATRAKQEAFAYGGCQQIVDELEHWRRQVSPSRYEADVKKPRCTYSEKGGVQSRECSETEYGRWRKK